MYITYPFNINFDFMEDISRGILSLYIEHINLLVLEEIKSRGISLWIVVCLSVDGQSLLHIYLCQMSSNHFLLCQLSNTF